MYLLAHTYVSIEIILKQLIICAEVNNGQPFTGYDQEWKWWVTHQEIFCCYVVGEGCS